jgi:hypothetical protein
MLGYRKDDREDAECTSTGMEIAIPGLAIMVGPLSIKCFWGELLPPATIPRGA